MSGPSPALPSPCCAPAPYMRPPPLLKNLWIAFERLLMAFESGTTFPDPFRSQPSQVESDAMRIALNLLGESCWFFHAFDCGSSCLRGKPGPNAKSSDELTSFPLLSRISTFLFE